MKKLLLLILLFLSLNSISQTTDNSRSLRLSYVSYYNSNYIIVVNNLQKCSIPIYIKWNNKDTAIYAGLIEVVRLPSKTFSDSLIKAKPFGRCINTTNENWDSTFVQVRAIQLMFTKN